MPESKSFDFITLAWDISVAIVGKRRLEWLLGIWTNGHGDHIDRIETNC